MLNKCSNHMKTLGGGGGERREKKIEARAKVPLTWSASVLFGRVNVKKCAIVYSTSHVWFGVRVDCRSPPWYKLFLSPDGGHNFRQENTFGFICLKLRFKMSVFVRYNVTLYLKFQKLIEKCVKQGLDNNEEIKLCIVNVKGMLMKLLLLPLKVKIDWRILPQCWSHYIGFYSISCLFLWTPNGDACLFGKRKLYLSTNAYYRD